MGLQQANSWMDMNARNSRKEIQKTISPIDSTQKLLQNLISTTPNIVIYSFDLDGHIKKWNSASEQLYGYTAEEIQDRKVQELILYPEDVPLFEIFLRDIKTTLQSCIPYEWKTKTRRGPIKFVRSTLSPIIEHGVCTEVYCISVDITSQKEAEEALYESEARYKDLFEKSTDLLAILDLEGNILSVNQAFTKFIGHPKDELLKMNISQLLTRNDLRLIKHRILDNIRKNVTEPLEYIWEKPDRSQGILEVSIQTICKKHRPIAFQVTARDITKRRMLEDELNQTYRQIIETLVDFIDTKDIYTGKHSQRLVKDCVYLAKQVHLSEKDIHDLEVAAILHDVGKIKIPKSILNKFGQLTEEERQILNQHAATGAHAIEKIPKFLRVSKIIRHHHERYDGQGYPDGIKGSDIPIGSRILFVVDAFDAMTNDRPYRKAISLAEAINELKRCKGSQFDPFIVDIYLDYIKRRYDGEITPEVEKSPDIVEEISLF